MSNFSRLPTGLLLVATLVTIAAIGAFLVPQFRLKHSDIVHDVSFSPDGRSVASAGDDGVVLIWDANRGAARALPGRSIMVFAVAFSPDGRTLAAESWDGTHGVIELREPDSGLVRASFGKHSYQGRALRFSPDGAALALGGRGVTLWDVASEQPRFIFKGPMGTVMSVAFSPDGKVLASGSYDGTVRLWDLVTGQERRTLNGQNGPISSVFFSSDGKHVASVSNEVFMTRQRALATGMNPPGQVRVWDASTGLCTLEFHVVGQASAVALSPDGATVAVGQGNGTVSFWSPSSGRSQGEIWAGRSGVNALAYSPAGTVLAAGCQDGTVRMLDGDRRK